MRPKKHQRNSLLIAIVSASLPAVIIGLLVYLLVTDRIEDEAKRTFQNQISYATERIDSNLSHLELAMAQWTFRLPLESNFGEMDIVSDYTDIQTIYRALTWVESSDPLIEEVSLYLVNQKAVIHDIKGIEKLTQADTITQYRKLVAVQRDMYWTDNVLNHPNSAPYMLVVRMPGGLAALFVEISADHLDDLISELAPDDHGSAVLLLEDGKPISLGRRPASAPSPLDAKLIASIPERRNSDAAAEIRHWDGASYSVSYASMKRIGQIWTIAAASPTEQMTKPVRLLSRTIVAASCLGLMLALVLSWVAYRQIYNPFLRLAQQLTGRKGGDDVLGEIWTEWSNLSRESQVLQERVDRQLPTLRESFLLQLVQGHLYFLSENELAERMSQYGWEIRGRVFAALVVRVQGLYTSEGKFSEGDEQLVTFAVANIADELTKGNGLDASVINFQDLTVGLLLRQPEELAREQLRSGLYRLAGDLAATLQKLLKVEITVSAGRTVAALRDIPQQFEDARSALSHRIIDEPQQIVDVEDLLPVGRDAAHYPFQAEQALLQALRMGVSDELDGLMNTFMQELKARATKEIEVQQGLLQLCGNVSNTILLAGYNPFEFSGGVMLWQEFASIRDPQAMAKILRRKLILPYLEELRRSQDLQLKRLVGNVLDTIHTTYMKDISLEYCADLHGTYPKRLSLGFKQVTGQTFIDYLTQYRLEQAKKRLRETDGTIGDIALQVGYQPAYFNRVFKKVEGITPGQYRERQERSQL